MEGTKGKSMLHRLCRKGVLGLVGIVLLLVGLGLGLALVPMAWPQAGGRVADLLRAVLGPRPVATLESASLRLQDILSGVRYRLSGGRSQISWAAPAPTDASLLPTLGIPTATPTLTPRPTSTFLPPTFTPTTVAPVPSMPWPTPSPTPLPPSATPSPTATPEETPPPLEDGWQAFGPLVGGRPVMWRATVKPDPTRPYSQVALVRIALSQVRLTLVPGRDEPAAVPGTPPFARPGIIPTDVVTGGKLLAAFNGGFQAVHGGYGMMVDGLVIRPPLDGLATLGVYCDGTVRVGAWGREVFTSSTCLTSYRQNCPLLIQAGAINPLVTSNDRRVWGLTIQALDTTWRSGLGISRSRQYAVYAVGNALTVEALAHALQMADMYYAMQLDINPAYTVFATFRPVPPGPGRRPMAASKLLAQMVGDQAQFLVPYKHDFVILTAAPGGARVTYPD